MLYSLLKARSQHEESYGLIFYNGIVYTYSYNHIILPSSD